MTAIGDDPPTSWMMKALDIQRGTSLGLLPFSDVLEGERGANVPWQYLTHATEQVMNDRLRSADLSVQAEPRSNMEKLVVLVRRAGLRISDASKPPAEVGDVAHHFPDGTKKEDLGTVQMWELPWRSIFPTVAVWHKWCGIALVSFVSRTPCWSITVIDPETHHFRPVIGCDPVEKQIDSQMLGLPRSRLFTDAPDFHGIHLGDLVRRLDLPDELPVPRQ